MAKELKPQCSVVIPAHNCEKYIKMTLDSVLNQTLKNIEVIVVDDCSTDSTNSIVAEYAKKDERVKLFKNEENLKVSKTRNFGIGQAKADWIALVDSDDAWNPNKLEKQFAKIEEKNAKLCFTGVEFIGEDSKPLNRTFSVPEKVNFKELLKQNVITCSSVVIKKDLLLKYPMYADQIHEDFVTWLKILKNEIDFAWSVNEPLTIYRMTANSKSRNKFKSFKMTYKTYRHVGIGFFKSLWLLGIYTIRSFKKYGKSAFKK